MYPDIAIVCGKPSLTDEAQDTLTNPKVVIEVLSPSTGYDYGEKFQLYRILPSFTEYVLIARDRPLVEIFCKSSDGRCVLSSYEGLDATAKIESLGIALSLAEIYARVPLETA